MNDTTSFIKFTKTRDIGQNEGKNSTVFLAVDDQLGDELVIKQMDKTKFSPEDYFLESKMLYASKHPNIVEIQYASQDEGNIYLAMPYYSKGSLNCLAQNRFLTVREIIKYALDLLSAVNYIHSLDLLHLDIKPSNILLDDSGKAVLTDFGLSRYVDENGVANQITAYQLHSEPERFIYSERTNQADIYQIGMTLYRLCNGIDILKYQLGTMGIDNDEKLIDNIINGKFPDRKYFMPHIPKKLQKVVLKALAVNPSTRYDNTISMMNDLSIIDDNLDWVFTGNMNNPYTKLIDIYQYDIIVKPNKDIECYRTNVSNKSRKIMNKHCIHCKNENDLGKSLAKALNSLK